LLAVFPNRTASKLAGYTEIPEAPERALGLGSFAASASGFGAFLFGIILPCGGFWYVVNRRDDMGGPLFWPFAAVAGALVGAIAGPLVSVPVQLLLRRFSRRS
jgi:hypothetical protein